MDSLSQFDADGTCIPFATDDQYIELELLDSEAGPPEAWPAWTDDYVWMPTDADYRPAYHDVYEPTPADRVELEQYFDRLDALFDLAAADEREDREATL